MRIIKNTNWEKNGLTLKANAQDDGKVERVSFEIMILGTNDIAYTAEDTNGDNGWDITWTKAKVGSYEISAIAYDNGGKSKQSKVITLKVLPKENSTLLYDKGNNQSQNKSKTLYKVTGSQLNKDSLPKKSINNQIILNPSK